jgi:hypothetical protein
MEAQITERVKDWQARACRSRLARQARLARRTRHHAHSDQIRAEEGQPGCLQTASLRSA